ncbi:tyrosine-type recombinase/integrase [Schinkia azotoformans]|uniref:tyrosine-type recombinase/integrase n=1 Tax=Schinkia azotoformans TaxID=1454 RepID=UPI002DBCCFD4|nr:tyrosine-type recombinase/integrase [Schinkia azotoformans]MEC1722848.1 tyrosine-type recombinase/integrase [Schinkia azotoformans]MED4414254.1 tyrosine-type recombinase/integrase [Schinkia azotoformans]
MNQEFIQELEREGKSPLTIRAYTKDIQQFHEWLFETISYETDAITETDLREYRQFLNLLKKLKVTSINRKIKSVVRYQRFLYKQGICKEEVDLKKVLQKNNIEFDYDVKIVEKQDLYRLKRTIESGGNKRDSLVYYLLFGTGVRCSEMVAIELDDIHITERNGKNNYSYIIIRNGKGNKVRKVNLNSDVASAIKAYLEVRPSVSSNKLLQGQRGTLTRLAINKLLEKYSKKAQLDYIVSPHMARHTFCSNLIKEGKVDPKTVAILSGHSSVDTLYRFYVNSSAEDKQRAVDNLNV